MDKIVLARFIVNLFDGLFYSLFIMLIYNKTFKSNIIMLFCIITAIENSISFKIVEGVPQPGSLFLSLGGLAILIATTKYIYRLKWHHTVLLILFGGLIQGLGNALAFSIFEFLNWKIESLTTDPFLLLIGSGIVSILSFSSLLLIKIFKSIFVLPKDSRGKYLVFISSHLVMTFLIIVFNIQILTNKIIYLNQNGSENASIAILLFILTGYFIFNIIYTINITNYEIKNQELLYQKFYNKSLENMMTEIRRFKHNFDNILASISGYIQVNQWDNLTKYVNELIEDKNTITPVSTMMLFNIKNAGIIGILLAKIEKAKEEDIIIKINIRDVIDEVNIKISDLCEILGIFLDNAIEEAKENDVKLVKMSATNTDGYVSFIIENSTKSKPDISKMFIKGWSTKGEERGLGLWIVNKIKNKYKNVSVNTLTDENSVSQELIIIS